MKINEIQELIKFVAKAGVSEVQLETKDFKITIKTHDKSKAKNEPVIMQTASSPAPIQPQPIAMPPVVVTPTTSSSPPSASSPSKAEKTTAEEANLITIKSPMIGTFYRRPAPDKPPYVEVGSVVKKGDVLCTIEAMKLFNEIESEVSGKIVKILVEDASPVEYDQPLFLVEPN